ncbi:hypothetical protein [Streptosporangium amethystogenes]|nr:hypothetical protein [Streptosporangium amethystogenes]
MSWENSGGLAPPCAPVKPLRIRTVWEEIVGLVEQAVAPAHDEAGPR